MIPTRATAKAMAKAIEQARRTTEGPKCARPENAALRNAAMVAIREIAKAAGAAGSETMIGQWRHDYDSLSNGCESRAEFLERFVLLTASFESATPLDLALLCLIDASKNASMAAYEGFSRELRLDALRDAGIAIGAFAMLENPSEIESLMKTKQARRAAAARHKDDRADREHVWGWLKEHRCEYKTDVERRDAIVDSKQVSLKSSTIGRLITEWNREQRNKRTAI